MLNAASLALRSGASTGASKYSARLGYLATYSSRRVNANQLQNHRSLIQSRCSSAKTGSAAASQSASSHDATWLRLLGGALIGLVGSWMWVSQNEILLDVNPNASSLLPASTSSRPQPAALDLQAANAKLRKEQQTRSFYAGSGRVGTAHVVRLASNDPVEDEWDIRSRANSWMSGQDSRDMSFFGVYDGHAGWTTSVYLRENLIPWVSAAIDALPKEATSAAVTNTIKDAFLSLDERIISTAVKRFRAAQGSAANADVIVATSPASSGSCALLAAFEPQHSMLRIACTGDSRAVIGQFSQTKDAFEATALSEDQSGSNKNEVERLKQEHPDEPKMVEGLLKQGRIFGLMCTRAFGDHRWKLDSELLKEMQETHFTHGPRPDTKTPPYVTARPEITETVVLDTRKNSKGHSRPSFAILATDGLWDHMSSEDAVRCVEAWLDTKAGASGKPDSLLNGSEKKVDTGVATQDEQQTREPLFKTDRGFPLWQWKPEWLAVEDDNAATHLVRNALGGNNQRFFRGLMSTFSPMSRNVRDDITVQVLFFDDAPGV